MPLNLPGIKLFDLTGKSAVITGGSKGLGLAMAHGLASAGCNIMIVNRNVDEGQVAARDLASSYPVKVLSFACDVTDQKQTELMAQYGIDQFDKIDILINSAGINIRGPIEDLSLDDFNKVMNVNVTGTWLCCKALVPQMKANQYGRIINLASTLGLVGLGNRTPYASSKGAIVQMTRTLGLELATDGICVNAICPGPFLTEMNQSIADTEDGKKFVVGATALARWAELKEIQGAAILLASDAASYMIGSLVVVDGGWTAR